jgi:hypothetical protein
MSCRNIDFIAVCLSALVLGALSQAPNIRFMRPVDPMRLQNAVSTKSFQFQQGLDQRFNGFQQRLDNHVRAFDSRLRDADCRFSRLLNQ